MYDALDIEDAEIALYGAMIHVWPEGKAIRAEDVLTIYAQLEVMIRRGRAHPQALDRRLTSISRGLAALHAAGYPIRTLEGPQIARLAEGLGRRRRTWAELVDAALDLEASRRLRAVS